MLKYLQHGNNMVRIEINTKDGNKETVDLNINALQHITVEQTISDEITDIDNIVVRAVLSLTITPIKIEFVPTCIPEHPFYVRWINMRGGYDYKMFEARHQRTLSISGNVEHQFFIEDTTAARRTHERLFFEANDSIAVGADLLSHDEFVNLSKIILSPKIEWFDHELTVWKEITIDGNAKAVWDSQSVKGVFEVKFKLPIPNTQQ